MSGAGGARGLLEGMKIKVDDSEFIYYVMNATFYS